MSFVNFRDIIINTAQISSIDISPYDRGWVFYIHVGKKVYISQLYNTKKDTIDARNKLMSILCSSGYIPVFN